MKIFSYIILFLLVIIGLTFAGLNAQPVEIHYYIGSRTIPLSLLLVITLTIGSLLGILVSLGTILRLRSSKRGLQKRLKLAEKEVENLRAIPLKDNP